jgi:hypothetical protein
MPSTLFSDILNLYSFIKAYYLVSAHQNIHKILKYNSKTKNNIITSFTR